MAGANLRPLWATVKQSEADVKQFECRCRCCKLILLVTTTVGARSIREGHSLLPSRYVHHHCLHGVVDVR